jgi:ABC-2 type transport system ATP-binding protein
MEASNPQARQNVGYLPENPSFYPFMTAREYLHFVGQIFKMPTNEIRSQTHRVLELLDLTQAADRSVKGFSKGMTQRLGLAQTLLHDPALYILDEPMSGLDPVGRALVKDVILALKQQGKTVFFSTHIIADVEAVCDRAGIIVNGRLTALEDVKNGLISQEGSYILYIKTSQGVLESHVVGNNQLNGTILQAVAQGATIERIEPQLKNLEKIFLSTIKTGTTV